ncbi:hypothetical protein IAD21_01522 [Abditibacteriota bacterium]|nr:hypothetical protein IAD21_01522 [Abditibacteriota bacterium]
MYVFGPYIVGALIGAPNPRAYLSPLALAFAAFFLFPANLLIYGANDIFDYETDVLNLKKRGYESLVPPDERKALWKAIALWCLPFVPLLFFAPRACWVGMGGFLFFSLFYSAPPIRAKAKPILDSAFNVLYIFPSAFGYFVCGGTNFSFVLFGAATLWAMAMHAYSAVPDIDADKEANVPTVATLLGLRATLLGCWAFYLLAAALSFFALRWLAVVLALVYTALMIRSLQANTQSGVMKVYRIFPVINAFAGASLWWFAVWQKPSFWPF